MDASPSASPDPDTAARRRSGRVVKAPAKFGPEAVASAASKRKRGDRDGDDAEDEELESDEDMSDDVDVVSDEDHPAPRSRKTPAQGGRAKKPSLKKPKINGTQPSAGHVARIPSRPKKAVRIEAGEKGTGIFGRLLGAPPDCCRAGR